MWIKYLLVACIGLSGGLIVSGGLFTVLFTVGLIPRFAGKTRTAMHVKIYEDAVILGSIFWNYVSIYEPGLPGKNLILVLYGTFSGIFVGCVAVAIAEMLNGIPVFSRRINFRRGLGIAVLFLAFGKSLGDIVYFFFNVFL